MLDDRTFSSHVYSEEAAAEIYGRVRENAPALRAAWARRRIPARRLSTRPDRPARRLHPAPGGDTSGSHGGLP